MPNNIKCPHCGKTFEPNEALTHQIEEQVLASISQKHEEEIKEEKDRNKKLSVQLDDLLDETRKLKRKDEDREIEMKKRLYDAEENIRDEVRKKTEDEFHLKNIEKDKVISDLKNSLVEMKRRAEQGYQQTQGESLELELEQKLRTEFPTDIITEVKKGQRGADILQIVVDKLGRKCGAILWESKNAKWSDGWISKLKEDKRQAKADICILVSVNMPSGINDFVYKDGVWICSVRNFLVLACSLRYSLVSVSNERSNNEGKDEKMAILYKYITGTEFRSRVEGIIEIISSLQDDIEKEKRYFNTKWARQEKGIRKVIDHTHGMYGDFQGVLGKSLPEIKTLELGEGTEQ